jgi:integrase
LWETEAEADEAVAFKLEHEKHRDKDSFAVRGEKYMENEERLARTRRGGKVPSFASKWSMWRLHIRTANFYRMRVKDIKRSHVQAHINALASKPAVWATHDREIGPTGKTLGEPTLRHVRSRLTHFFNSCAELEVNPAQRCTLPNISKIERRKDSDRKPHLHADEIDRLFALDMKPWHRAAYALGIYAGLRGGEIFGLTWQDVHRLDGDEPELHVRASWDSETKTVSSQREVPMLPQLVAAMRVYRDSLGAVPIAGPVFPNPDGKVRSQGGRPANWYDTPARVGRTPGVRGYRSLARIRDHIQFRHLRHTCATHLLAGTFTGGYEWPIEKVSELLGHESVLITLKHYASRGVERLHVEVRKGLAVVDGKNQTKKQR